MSQVNVMDQQDTTRRNFLTGTLGSAGLFAAGSAIAQDKPPAKDDPHAGHGGGGGKNYGPTAPSDRGKLTPGRRKSGESPVPVEHPDIGKLPWKMVNGVKEFHLYARHMQREFLPNQWFDVWGYGGEPGPKGENSMPDMTGMPAKAGATEGSMPGPTIEVVEGDKVRIIVHNELPEATSMHWHGLDVPNSMDGVIGLVQDAIPPGGMFTYEFELRQNGTFFYHTHVAMQQALGMVGLFIVHPKASWDPPVDRDFALILQEWAILPGASVTNTMSMEFNIFTINGRAAPYITPMVVRLGDRVRIRLVNFSVIDHHPMHLHGMTFWVTGTEGGRIPESAWYPSNNVLVAVAQARDIEFVANNPGDWIMHCHMFHHMMNFMSSMAGPMGGDMRGMQPGGNMANGMGMLTRGPALNPELGGTLGRGTGENTGTDRAVGNGPMMAAGGQPGMKGMDMKGMPGMGGAMVPGFPQDMSGMSSYSAGELKKLTKPETRGMRNGWFADVGGLTTIVRVLPPDLYDKVMLGKGEVAPGASVPGATPGKTGSGHEGMKMDPPGKDQKNDSLPKKDEQEGLKK
jgi:FtsP/CotA-like multicopper oxidase with cupredoxin domain